MSKWKPVILVLLVLLNAIGFANATTDCEQMPLREQPGCLFKKLDDAYPKSSTDNKGLLVTISQVQSRMTSYGVIGSYLITVKNTSNNTYKQPMWSCVMLQGDKVVGEDEIYIRFIPANEIVYKQFGASNATDTFDNVKCRLTWARAD
jgi:hypothetical protein